MQNKLIGGYGEKFCDEANRLFKDGWEPLREYIVPDNSKQSAFIMMILQKPYPKTESQYNTHFNKNSDESPINS